MTRTQCASALMTIATALAAEPAFAQESAPDSSVAAAWFPSSPWFPSSLVVRPLVGGPTWIGIGGGPIVAERDPPHGSGNLSPESNVAFGYRLPVLRVRGVPDRGPGNGRSGRTQIDLSIEAGLTARFALGKGTNGLINSDFRVAVPLGIRFSPRWEGTLALAHVSSHLGDNILEQSPGLESLKVSRNGVEAVLLYRIGRGLRAYAGAGYNGERTGTETFAGQLGLNLDRRPDQSAGLWPIGSLDLAITDLTDRVAVDAILGLGFRTGAGEMRLGLAAHAGPSSMGQYREVDETWFGLFLEVVPGVVARSGMPL